MAVNIQVPVREDDLSDFQGSIYILFLEIRVSVLLGELFYLINVSAYLEKSFLHVTQMSKISNQRKS